MSKLKIKTRESRLLADTITPVSMYLKLRDRFANSFLLESSDYHGAENSFSYICCSPLASIKAYRNEVKVKMPNSPSIRTALTDLKKQISDFASSFETQKDESGYIKSGLFGYFNYDAINHFGDVSLDEMEEGIPVAQYHVFQFIIALDHFKNECHVIEAVSYTHLTLPTTPYV